MLTPAVNAADVARDIQAIDHWHMDRAALSVADLGRM